MTGAGTLADGTAVQVVDLAQPLHPSIPVSPSHPGFKHALLRRHGDAVRVDGTSGANDLLVLGTHTATHMDALAHISHDGLLHGGVSAAEAQVGGRYLEHGIHTVGRMIPQPVVCTALGKVARLDDLLGDNFVVLGVEVDPTTLLSSSERAAWGALGARYATVRPQDAYSESDSDIIDIEGVLIPWITRYGATGIAVRPDKFIAAADKSGLAVPAL